jgi:hypothetical protein
MLRDRRSPSAADCGEYCCARDIPSDFRWEGMLSLEETVSRKSHEAVALMNWERVPISSSIFTMLLLTGKSQKADCLAD